MQGFNPKLDNKTNKNHTIMKHLNLLFTALLLLCCIGTAKAEEVTIDGIKYDVVTKAKQATVIESETKYSGDIVIPSEITYNDVIYSVTSIGDRAFYLCTGLTSIEIPNSVTSIGEKAFYDCYGLTSITIPNSVKSIGEDAFYYCTWLTSVVIGNSVTNIGDYAFTGCTRLTSVEIGNGVTSIGNGAFCGCKGLTSITIPNSVTSIRNYAFSGCTGLTSIIIPNSVKSIGSEAFYGCSGLTSITIPNSVTSIGDYAFSGCEGLTSITIPNSVKSIGYKVFYGCSGLTSIEIPNSVTSIVNQAFEGCTGLTSVTIGTGVKNIRSKAFAKCSNLTDVYCLATSVPSAESDAFNESYPEYMTLHVPEEAINSYKTTAPWSSFGTVVTLDGDVTETPKCTTPTVLYSNGKLHFECETEGAEFVTEITSSDFNKFYNNDINLTATYNISVYATATGYENSETVNATLCWIECDCDADDTSIINIPATAALVTSNNGVLSISCQLDGEAVAVYTTDGVLIATTTIENGAATVTTGLSKGSVAIVKIDNKSIKVIVD